MEMICRESNPTRFHSCAADAMRLPFPAVMGLGGSNDFPG